MTLYVYRCDQCGDITPTIVIRGLHDHIPMCRHHGGDFPMERVRDSAKVLLPLDQEPAHLVTPGMVPLKVKHLHAAGFLIPETQHALEWMHKNRHTNGMAEAFLKVGGRRCIDLVAFARLVREKRA